MEIVLSQANGKVPISVIRIKGDLDASSYLDLVNTAQKLYNEGMRYLLLDMTDLAFISSAGLASLTIITRMFSGEKTAPGDGWGNFKDIDHERQSSLQPYVKLLNPSADVDKVLDTVGFKQFFEVYTDLNSAVASY